MEIKNTKLRYLEYLSEGHETQENMGRTTLTTLQGRARTTMQTPRGCLKAELLYFSRIQGILPGQLGVSSGRFQCRLCVRAEGSPEGVSMSV